MWPDQLDNRAYWFRQYFVGKPYITLVGMDQDIIISIVRERTNNSGNNHRVIYREKKVHFENDQVMILTWFIYI